MEKMKGNGYSLTVGAAEKLSFNVKVPGASATAESKVNVNDGQWHHAIVEADRRARTLTVYVDGKKDGAAKGVDASVSLANEGDVYVGGTPEGRHLDGGTGFPAHRAGDAPRCRHDDRGACHFSPTSQDASVLPAIILAVSDCEA